MKTGAFFTLLLLATLSVVNADSETTQAGIVMSLDTDYFNVYKAEMMSNF